MICIANWGEGIDQFSVFATKNGKQKFISLINHQDYFYSTPIPGNNITYMWKIKIPTYINVYGIIAPDSIVYFCGNTTENGISEAIIGYFNFYEALMDSSITLNYHIIRSLNNLKKITQFYVNGTNKVFAYGNRAGDNDDKSLTPIVLEGYNILNSPTFYTADLIDETPNNLIDVGANQVLVGYSAQHNALTIRRLNFNGIFNSFPGQDRFLLFSSTNEFLLNPLTTFMYPFFNMAIVSQYRQYPTAPPDIHVYIFDLLYNLQGPHPINAFYIRTGNIPFIPMDISFNESDTILSILCNRKFPSGLTKSVFLHANPISTTEGSYVNFFHLDNVIFRKMKGILAPPYGTYGPYPSYITNRDILSISNNGHILIHSPFSGTDCFDKGQLVAHEIHTPEYEIETKPLAREERDANLETITVSVKYVASTNICYKIK